MNANNNYIMRGTTIIGILIGIYRPIQTTIIHIYTPDQNGAYIIIDSFTYGATIAINMLTHTYEEVYSGGDRYIQRGDPRISLTQDQIINLLKHVTTI